MERMKGYRKNPSHGIFPDRDPVLSMRHTGQHSQKRKSLHRMAARERWKVGVSMYQSHHKKQYSRDMMVVHSGCSG